MRKHEPVDVGLPALGPLAVVLPNHRRAVPEDVRDLLKRGALFQQPGRERMAEAVGVSFLHP